MDNSEEIERLIKAWDENKTWPQIIHSSKDEQFDIIPISYDACQDIKMDVERQKRKHLKPSDFLSANEGKLEDIYNRVGAPGHYESKPTPEEASRYFNK